MKKKQLKKRNRQTKPMPAEAKTSMDLKSFKRLRRSLSIIIGILAFVLYAQSINHDYTLDDHKVTDENAVTKQGITGIPTILKTDYWYGSGQDELRGPVYRPTSLVLFAIVWEFSPNNAHIYHFINVLLYAITCMFVFALLARLFPQQNLLLAFICSLLYVAHPIHTEVVNNIKSLDEILWFLFEIMATWAVLKYISDQSKLWLAVSGLCFFLGLISKETAISFLVIIPLVVFFFSQSFKTKIVPVAVVLIGITGVWLLLRMMVFTDLPRNIVTATSALNNTLYAAPDFTSKYATAFYILLRYVGLLLFPHPLSCDYNFAQIKIRTLADPGALLGLIGYLAMAVYVVFNFKKKAIIAFAILFFLITLAPVSNIFFLGGSSMAERFLYAPSLGFCLVLAYLIITVISKQKLTRTPGGLAGFLSANSLLLTIAASITSLYSVKTISRNKDWKDTLTIFSHDIHVSPNSATANELLGNALLLRAAKSTVNKNQSDTFNLAKSYLKRALEIAPGFFYAASNLGYIYLTENKPDSAFLYTSEGLKHGPNDVQLNYYFGSSLFLQNKFDEAIRVLQHTISLKKDYEATYFVLASSYLGKGDPKSALESYSKLIEINPNNGKAYFFAAGVLRAQGDTLKAKEFMNKAASLGYKPG